jgi:uncharacterized protein (DUF1501 family)
LSFLGVGAPLAINLAAFAEAAAFESTDYKALVCVFMFGGNDHGNTVIPYDTANYDLYNAIRGGGANRTAGGIAYGRSDLNATALTPVVPQTLTDNLQYALNPKLTGLKSLWDAGKCAVLLNVGTLIKPLTLAQYKQSNSAQPRPPKLFSHNDQQTYWQTLSGGEGSTSGWGGRMGDLALSSNSYPTLTCISASGNAVFESGNTALQYQISTSGAIAISGLTALGFNNNATARTALSNLITTQSGQVLENEYVKVVNRSINMRSLVTSSLSSVSVTTSFDTNGAGNSLADQLKTVARLIAGRATTGAKRQVFFVSMGGFDNHDFLMRDHPGLMGKLDEALSQFYAATVELGVANKVTTFTASDFGRTLASNGDGSDHGWGGHHFIVGGAVDGGKYYGTAPKVSVTSDDQVGQGRLLPSTSVDQYAATLANWFGVSNTELSGVLPNINNYSNKNLGFMA